MRSRARSLQRACWLYSAVAHVIMTRNARPSANPVLVRHRPSRPGADRARLGDGPDHGDAQPRHGGGTGAALDAARASGRPSLRDAVASPAARLWLRYRRPPHALDRRRHDAARRRRCACGSCDGLDGDATRARHCARRDCLHHDRHRRLRGWHLAAGPACKAHRSAPAQRRRLDRMDHDGHGFYRNHGRSGSRARSVLGREADCRLLRGIGDRHPSDACRGVEHRRRGDDPATSA